VAYQLKIEQKTGFLHCTVTGSNTPTVVRAYMQEIMQESAARGCPRLLIEEHLEGPRLGTMEVFALVTSGAKLFHGLLDALAFVDVNAEADVMRFAEDLAVNRGIPVKVFRTVEGAEQWLHQQVGAGGSDAQSGASKPSS
jgi:hypothetical protein